MDFIDKFSMPIDMDNKNLRKEVPSITAHFNAVKDELSELPLKDGLVLDRDLISIRRCPVCDSNNKKQLFTKWGFKYVTCKECTHVFVENSIKEEKLLELYADSLSDELDRKTQESKFFQIYWYSIYSKYLEYAAECGIESGKILDVGAGSGSFLKSINSNSFELFATEFSDSSAENLKNIVDEKNYYHQIKIEDIDFGGIKFDLITMWGVLEHIYNPKSVLKKIANILTVKGLFIALVPNFSSRAIKILGITTPTLNPRGHIQNYTDLSIKKLAEDSGLRLLRKFGELPIIDLMHDHLKVNDDLKKEIVADEECYYSVYALTTKDNN